MELKLKPLKFKTPRELLESSFWQEYCEDEANGYHKINAQQLAKNPIVLDCLVAPKGHRFIQLDACLVEGTEVLTQKGWKLFEEVTLEDKVWQVNPQSLLGSWTSPSRVIKQEYRGDIYWFGNRRGTIGTSIDHTMLWAGQQTHKRKDKKVLRKVTKSQEGIPSTATTILTSSMNKTVSNFSKEEIWIACMLAADGAKTPYNKYTIEVSKPRKRNKIRELLQRDGIIRPPRQHQTQESESWYGIEFSSELLCPNNKRLILDRLGQNQVDIFIEALSFWDSCHSNYKTGRFYFSSTDEIEIDNVQVYLTTSGYEANKKETSKGDQHRKPCFHLSIRKAAGIRLRPKHDEWTESYSGTVGCVTVPEGFIQVRYKGQTFITGNCALEPTVLAELSGDPKYRDIYASGIDHDVYLYVSIHLLDQDGAINNVYNVKNPTKESIGAAKKQFKKERSIGKVFQLMSTYKAGAAAIHRKLNLFGIDLTKEEVEEIRGKYWGPELFGGVLEYEQGLLDEADQNGGWLLNGMGRPFALIERKKKDIMNTIIQSTGHDITDLLIYYVDKLAGERGLSAEPVIPDYHDETIWMVPEEQAEQMMEVMRDALARVNDDIQFSIPITGEPENTKNFTEFKGPDPVEFYEESRREKNRSISRD